MVIIYIFQLLLIPPLFGEKSQKAEANIYLCILLSLLVQESSSNIVSSFVLLMGLDFTFGGHLPRIKKNLHSLSQCTYQNLSAKADSLISCEDIFYLNFVTQSFFLYESYYINSSPNDSEQNEVSLEHPSFTSFDSTK